MCSEPEPLSTAMEADPDTEHTPPAPVGKKEKRFECSHCQRLFARLEHLQRHERIRELHDMTRSLPNAYQDSGVKPFTCTECDYSFTRRYDIR